MTPAFGFSVGDFIGTINLIRKISKALKETGGASSEYQDTVVELNGLQHALQQLEALEPTEDNLGHVNAIRGMALACRLPLQEFLKELDKYEGSLGPWAHRTSVGDFGRKARWAVSFGKEVEKLRAIVAAKQISINLLLATHSSQTLSSLNRRTKHEYNASKARHEEHRAALDRVWGTAQNLKDAMDSTADETKAGLQTLSNRVDSSNTSIASLITIGDQILAFVKSFPQEVRGRLRAITQADWRTYQAVLRLQESISQAPTSLHESNIQFTNALGEYRSLPYEYFCDWEPFEGLLRAQFKDKPGEMKILNGNFHIINSKRGSIVKKDHWHRNISQGIHLKMSMVMLHLRTSSGKCPQPDCAGVGRVSSNDPLQLMCDTCSLAFFPETTELEDAFGKAKVSDEAVTRQQVEEDMRLYGTRPQPSDVISIHDNHENMRQKEALSKRDASHVEATTGRPAKMPRLFEDARPENKVLTAMDWHSGASPLEAWLNQSAIPAVGASQADNERTTSVESQIAQEIEEIKNFRSIHLMAVQHPNSLNGKLYLDKDFASLRQGAQIYYRNIKDKFPLIPGYLARRLAEANLDRAAALQTRRHVRDAVGLPPLNSDSALQVQQSAVSPGASKPSQALRNIPYAFSAGMTPLSDLGHFKLKRSRIACINCLSRGVRCSNNERIIRTTQCSRCSELQLYCRYPDISTRTRKGMAASQWHWNLRCINCARRMIRCCSIDERSRPTPCSQCSEHQLDCRYESSLQTKVVSEGFWNGGPPSRRPSSAASIHSRSSSMNSSLHESPRPDLYQQNDFAPPSPSTSPRGLLAPPVDLGKHKRFDCDLCGKVIHVERRRQWQNHVMSDLRPYLCTFEDCARGDKTYARRKFFSLHESSRHDWHNDSCPFCQETLSLYNNRSRDRHVGRHMEEIAFAVVPKAYEDWEFYSDSSGDIPRRPTSTMTDYAEAAHVPAPSETYRDTVMGPYRCEKVNPSTGKSCNVESSRAYDLTRHEDTIHCARKQKIRCDYCDEEKKFTRRDALARHMRVVHPYVDFPGRKRRRE